ncbi:glucosamine 6-phosphate synthetase [Lysinibacillus yapensis]|uniref:Glucosamine 6-phosphate synthetase n=1 Tax=Ureibacillus yapensis TaxID=2304605 RepID=A0A396S957_9BACL|nr:glucosamine 6-phosphate synthetase [Lysinibacillus yapensis]RHW37635.1 glucosamine 6-phosphate synthetase [Lysinibacillus yapensis]
MQNVSKRTILWIVPILIIVAFWYYYGPQEEITDNEYITYIKQSKIGSTQDQYEQALDASCSEGKWVYFKTQKNQNVVEFKGACEIEGNQQDVNLQFVVEDDQKSYQVGVLLLDGEQQTEEQRNEFLNSLPSN